MSSKLLGTSVCVCVCKGMTERTKVVSVQTVSQTKCSLSILIKCNFYEKKNAHMLLKTGCVISKPKSRHDRSGGQTWD